MPDNEKPADQSGRTAGLALARFIRTVRSTSKLTVEPPDAMERFSADTPQIAAMWHGQFLLIPTINPADAPTDIMVARHGDGNIVSYAMATFGLGLIRGAGAGERKRDRGGRAALRAAIKSLASGRNVAMTADVPPGPARKAGLGIVTLARLSGRPIVPVAVATNRFIAFDTWSRFTVNLPFSRMALVKGDPIHVPRDANAETLERLRQEVEDALNRATTRAYQICGGNLASATPPSALPPDAPPVPIGLRLRTYRGLTRVLSPLAPLVLKYREHKGKEDPARRGERLGERGIAPGSAQVVWFHAASVGETNAILPVIKALRAKRPSYDILLTTGTVTSAGLAAERLPDGARHQYMPIDTPGAVERFLKTWQPKLAVLVESEIWPNLIISLSERDIPIVLVNARMSRRSYQRWWSRRNMARQLFSRFSLVLAQNESLTRRFRSLGSRTVIPVGNIKNDAPPLPVEARDLATMQESIGSRRVFLAASTHPGEDEAVIEAHRRARAAFPDLLTIIAPRHPHRADAIADLIRSQGLAVAKRSAGEAISDATDIYIADTIGELGLFYRLSDLAFIGGSLVPHGGQNPIEALNANVAILHGPHTTNFEDAYREIAKFDAGLKVEDGKSLGETVTRLLQTDIEISRLRTSGRDVLERMSGALDRTVTEILKFLPDERCAEPEGEPSDGDDVAETNLQRAS